MNVLFSSRSLALALALGPFLPSVHGQTCPPSRDWQIGQGVDTTSGTVIGHPSDWKPEVSEYLGIPYAQPPVGDLRFDAPKPFAGDGEIVAANFSASCPSTIKPVTGPALENLPPFASRLVDILGQKGDTFDEDCLTLNVWTKPQTGEEKKTVMVWIYGGGFTSGNSGSPAYNGARLANEHDVIVVSINYRVGIFGFPGVTVTPERNPGLLDQRLGLEWVRDNIEKFGGDPAKITLFGQSAGGASTDFHSFAWVEDPIVRAYIPQSGVATNTMGGGSNNTAAWNNATEKLSCPGEAAGEESLTCMRSKSMPEIIEAIMPPEDDAAAATGGFTPTADDKVIFADYKGRRQQGLFAKLPVLVGNTDNEMGLYSMLGCVSSNETECNLDLPPIDLPFVCGAAAAAKSRVDHGVKAWRYIYAATWPNQDIGVRGAWHGADIGAVFGTTQNFEGEPDTPEQEEFGKHIREAWTGFAKDPEHGLEKFEWPVYNPLGRTVINLGGERSGEITYKYPWTTDRLCSLLDSGMLDRGIIDSL
ncbi:hypothetical protein AJ79_05196 [Helicocarpus griseus UAMH5409]|uniref:Carboxylic ester hydrolase n=1 Tax=Helicocarpus griseus UAMH5409 TaxID=1447875 RepID=A0A2B7XPT5_9EURO|nr:hypothetical protein AJ79_05196 [Helicocarpus griseus UAMH5409]